MSTMPVVVASRHQYLNFFSQQLIAAVTKRLFNLRIHEDDVAPFIYDHHGIRRGFEQVAKFFFRAFAITYVTKYSGKESCPIGFPGRKRGADRDLGTVLAPRRQFYICSCLESREPGCEMFHIFLAVGARVFWHEQTDGLPGNF